MSNLFLRVILCRLHSQFVAILKHEYETDLRSNEHKQSKMKIRPEKNSGLHGIWTQYLCGTFAVLQYRRIHEFESRSLELKVEIKFCRIKVISVYTK